ncbi:Gag-Pol [Cucumis melo var. makuwa]|uniref:Gag-Pol n=1 Tax=Cucumis melo var. makuwa TaxID=1194695 RepID=A0A5A7UYA7_CUCMM|nr:Gag-Pol [Cucumis melo var. makuwa]
MESNVAYCLLTEDGEPLTLKDAMTSSDAAQWMTAMQEEIEALHKNKTWELVMLPQGRKPIGNKIVLAICATFDLHLEQLAVKTAFLHGDLEEEIYMLQLEGFEAKGKDKLVCKLNKSLYGLKQALRCWYKSLDPYAYFKRFGEKDFIVLLLYVDDMLVVGSNKDHIEELKAHLAREFEMKDLGLANKILGMQIHRDINNRKIWLS